MNILLLLPTHLYPEKIIRKLVAAANIDRIILWEHSHYFVAYKYNKKRLLLHRASCLEFVRKYSSVGQVIHLQHPSTPAALLKHVGPASTISTIHMFEDTDRLGFAADLFSRASGFDKVVYHGSPSFLLTAEDLLSYHSGQANGSGSGFGFDRFYRHFAAGLKSTDRNNRQKLPSAKREQLRPFYTGVRHQHRDRDSISQAGMFVESQFRKNPGSIDGFIHPVTSVEAKSVLKSFCRHRLRHFAPYQDYIDSEGLILFHSFLSSSLNIGIITPQEVLATVRRTGFGLEVLEAFIRQMYWREYQRYCYFYVPPTVWQQRYFKYKRDYISPELYAADSGIPYIDNAVRRAFSTGYLHHIERLMVIGSFMLLQGTDPRRGYQWFMEFACDSYEWVMHQNVYEMVFFVSGGATMRRPYFCSSHYILKMSNMTPGPWQQVIDKLFHQFIKTNRRKLERFTWAYPVIAMSKKK